jgi:hypothetical protein
MSRIVTPDVIENGGGVWFDWPSGPVTVNSVDSIEVPITAISVVSVSGDVSFDIVGS